MRLRPGAILGGALVLGGLGFAPAAEAQMPTRVGTCVATTIARIGTRFSDTLAKPKGDGIDEGTSVDLKNGVYGVSYAYVDAVARSRVGDRVMTCLVLLPTGCPRGDDRGKMYTTTNLRTLDSWTLPDSQHMCGGA
ncbi:hypothetical protein ABID82_001111 [Methylobacterium sp. PvP062]|uniref:Uncharacterized protein n=1 Tax=Methylobacterium radiotolerans TaxID=31998 RepID=A0ABV2NFT1_9HYPH|nr:MULTISPECIES: hypothetical protein [unclassified Methylobacterium]MBP2497908.1 hypothetical protein [Methylobacterium sp. PvP105]MBP2502221.1 hypothetical protein [Methylobacterium sp. PvP109]MCX7334923.1 hypothetical protein [Hyphomicrobiales bacterium]